MKINVITINRAPNNYIAGTLESLRASDWQTNKYPVTLCAGSDDTEYLTAFNLDILPWREAEPENKWVGFCLNYVRALRYGFGPVVVLEDDIYLCPDWLSRLQAAVAELTMERYVLSLYSANNLSSTDLDRGKHYRSYPATSFFGTQAVYFPETVRYEVADYIYANRHRQPGDILLSEWSNANNCLYALQGSLVQHVGHVSTGVGGDRHTAWNLLCSEATI